MKNCHTTCNGTIRALGKCLDVTGDSTADGAKVQLWSCTGGANQRWNAPAAGDSTPSAPMAVAPYLYNGWGRPPDPATITRATGVKWFTLAFVLSNGHCNPQWGGSRPLTGGVDQQTVTTVLAAAYQKVIDAYGLKAIDIDIEADAYSSATVQQRTVRPAVYRRSRRQLLRCEPVRLGLHPRLRRLHRLIPRGRRDDVSREGRGPADV